MRSEFQMFDFPQQRVPNSRKKEADWYAACCDWVIAQGQNNRDSSQLEIKYGILQGKIPDEFYKKYLILIMLLMKIYSFSCYYA